MRSPLALACLAFTACFSPIPEAQTQLGPVVVAPAPQPAAPTTSPEVVVPSSPVTAVVDALAPNPPATVTDTSELPVTSHCRGDDYLRDVRRPQPCVDVGCLFAIGRDRTPQVLEVGGGGFQVLATDGPKTAWQRTRGQTRAVMVADGAAAPRQVASLLEGAPVVRFDGDDLLVVEAVSSAASPWSRVTRYPADQPESARQLVMEVPGRLRMERPLAVHAATGRVFVLTSIGLFFSPPRRERGLAGELALPRGASPTAFSLLPSGGVLLGVGADVWWAASTTSAPAHLATLPGQAVVQAIAPYGTGFVAVASSQVFVLEGAGPIRRVLARSDASPYQTTEAAVVVSGRQLLLSTLCLSWSSYPGYDVAVLDPDAKTARWWWEVYPSQWDVPDFPVSRANVGGNQWSSVEVHRSSRGFVTSSLP